MNSPVKLGNEMIGCEERHLLIFSKALLALSVQTNGLLDLLSSCIGAIMAKNELDWICSCRRFLRNCWIQTRCPMRHVVLFSLLESSFC